MKIVVTLVVCAFLPILAVVILAMLLTGKACDYCQRHPVSKLLIIEFILLNPIAVIGWCAKTLAND